jgi:hypothetical protein
MYMAQPDGFELFQGVKSIPRGLLMNWSPGTGKTLGFISAGLFLLHRRSDIYKNAVIVVIINKSLQETVLR